MEFKHEKEILKLAHRIIKEQSQYSFIKENGIKIAYLSCDVSKKKGKDHLIIAETIKSSDREKFLSGYDFFIIFRPEYFVLEEKQQYWTVFHELEHIGQDELTGDLYELTGDLYVKEHDIEDFYDIIDKIGSRWEMI